MTIVERAAYLKGLVDGLGLESDSRDAKLWRAVTELVSDMAHEIEDLQTDNLDMADALDEVCEELGYLEDLCLDLDQPEDFMRDEDDDYNPDLRLYEADDEEEPEEEESEAADDAAGDEDEELSYDGVLYDVTCPSCGKEITFDEETLNKGSITCPDCGEVLEFDLDSGEDK